MLTSLTDNLKIPLCFYFNSSSVSGFNLKAILNNILFKLSKINIFITIINCDQGSTNIKLSKELKVSPEFPYFISCVNNQIFFFFRCSTYI